VLMLAGGEALESYSLRIMISEACDAPVPRETVSESMHS
jgi:hypothetical protein